MAELTLEALKQQLDEQAKKMDEQTQVISKQSELITDLQGKLLASAAADAKPKQPVIPTESVTVGKKEYKWNVAVFALPGSDKKYTAEEASLDKDLLGKILKIEGQGLLKELV